MAKLRPAKALVCHTVRYRLSRLEEYTRPVPLDPAVQPWTTDRTPSVHRWYFRGFMTFLLVLHRSCTD